MSGTKENPSNSIHRTIELELKEENILLREWAEMNSCTLEVIDVDPQTGHMTAGYDFLGTFIECPFVIAPSDIK